MKGARARGGVTGADPFGIKEGERGRMRHPNNPSQVPIP